MDETYLTFQRLAIQLILLIVIVVLVFIPTPLQRIVGKEPISVIAFGSMFWLRFFWL